MPIAARIAATASAYFATAWLGLKFHSGASSSITLIWPPTGVGLAAARLYGPRMLVGVYLGAFAVNSLFGAADPTSAAIIAIGNASAVAIAWWILTRRHLAPFVEGREHLGWLALAAAVGCLASATIGVAALAITGVTFALGIGAAWLLWWLGDFLGMVLIEPLILVLMKHGEPIDV